MDDRDEDLREAVRLWLRATDRLAAADADAAEDTDLYAVVLELAEEVGLARLRVQRALVEQGWSPPSPIRERPRAGH